MVYCTKCGFKNSDDARYCIQCGKDLESPSEKSLEKRAEEWGEEFGKRAEECFGLPNGGLIMGLVIGVMILLWGTSALLDVELWPLMIVVFGIVIIVGVLYTYTRRD